MYRDLAVDRHRRLAEWFGLNRATLAVLVVIGCLGLSEEVWSNFLSLYFKEQTGAVLKAAAYIGAIGFLRNLLEGIGYVVGGRMAHRLGPRFALVVSAIPVAIGSACMLVSHAPWAIAVGALLMSNWEPLSVPATYEVVGSEVPKNRRTIAFAVQSIQKRLPKVIGPAGGAFAFAIVGYWLNVSIALGLVVVALLLQLVLTPHMRPKVAPPPAPLRAVMRAMPRELRLLLSAEIFIRWGDWFAREFAPLYVAARLLQQAGWNEVHTAEAVGGLIALMNLTALTTYVPIAKWIDRLPSPRPFIGTTFLLFALFPISLVMLPRVAAALGLPLVVGFVFAYVLNGLREIGEPARKALISGGFPPEVRARAVGLYWGLRSFAFCPAPLVAAWLWSKVGPDVTFLIGGGIGLVGTLWFAATNRLATRASAILPARE